MGPCRTRGRSAPLAPRPLTAGERLLIETRCSGVGVTSFSLDHRITCELTWNTFRNHLVLEYEIPKYDGDMGQPNFFVPLDKEAYTNKVDYLMKAFQSQRNKRWFERETFMSLMRLRGMECNAPCGYAEGFYARKLVL